MVGPPYSKKEVSHPISTQEENQKDNTSMALKSLQVLSMPLNLTGRMAITYGWMLLRWKCTTLVLHLKS